VSGDVRTEYTSDLDGLGGGRFGERWAKVPSAAGFNFGSLEVWGMIATMIWWLIVPAIVALIAIPLPKHLRGPRKPTLLYFGFHLSPDDESR
jgi:hypothetical protein